MSKRLEPRDCPECGVTYQPSHAKQKTCSRSCGAARSYRLFPKRRDAWWKASVETRRPRNLALLKAKLAGCKTLGEAYRLGYTKGYGQGWTARDRKDRRRAA